MDRTYINKSICGHLDMPIGDPFGGMAYGKKEMPFVVGAAITAVGAATAAGATAATVAMAAVSVVAAAATVSGLVMSVVGAVTGDKELMQIGGIVGLAGGLTSWATSAFTAASSVASTAVSAAAPAAGSSATEAVAGAAGGLGAATTEAITPAMSSVAQGSVGAVNNAASSGVAGIGSAGILGKAGATALNSALPTAANTGIGMATAAEATASGAGAVTSVANQSKSFFSQLLEPKNLLEIGKLGAGMLQGSFSEDQANKKLAIEQGSLDLQKQSLANNIMVQERQNKNANSIPNASFSVRKPTQEELDAAAENKAKTKQMAITPAAGAK